MSTLDYLPLELQLRGAEHREVLHDLCLQFVEQFRSLLENTADELIVNLPDLIAFSRILRQRASSFTGQSEPFWLLIDALGFYEDALTDRWPYMTHERRVGSLVISEQMASSLTQELHPITIEE